MGKGPSTRPSLLVRLRDPRDERAWAEFVALYTPLVHRLARAKGFQEADIADLTQDIFRAVAGAIERWDPDPAKGRFRAWLFRIARNLLVNFLAGQRRSVRGTGSTSVHELLNAEPARDTGAEAEFQAEFQRRAFRWAAQQVKTEFADSTWQAFWRTGVESHSVAVVAQELGLSTGAVYIARSRVLARLRERVLQLTDDTGLNMGDESDDAASGKL